jgi:hypothetical protein
MSKLSVSTSTYPLQGVAGQSLNGQGVASQPVRLVLPHSVSYPFFSASRVQAFGNQLFYLLLFALVFVGLAYFSVWMRSTIQPTYFISCWQALDTAKR